VIFATCGSSHLPFERLMQALAVLPADELIVQHGPAQPPPAARAVPFLSYGEVVELIEEADVVVSHAGVGSIICAIRAGHTPIVFPRLKRYAETVDDHQAELATALEQRGTVRVTWTPEDLLEAIRSIPPRGAAVASDAVRLNAAVRAAIHGQALAPAG
jgi:UDP-N-acetylglucosamine--N-acetylmuramyl-(pentapeptide) pyrophosphoryl-undecaprenol N-acetylglucosamine transferase